MDIHEFEIEFDIKTNEFEIELENVVKEIKPKYEQIVITPSTEEQIRKGSFDKVTVEAIENLTDEITGQDELIENQETAIEDIIEALKDKAGMNNKLQEKTAVPNTEEQEIVADEGYTGLSKVIVAGDENLVAENIKEGTSIFGVVGIVQSADIKITKANYLFNANARLEYLNEFLNFCENVTTTEYMFSHCDNLIELDLSNLDTSNVITMQGMFNYCSKLTELNISNFNTSKTRYMNNMFSNCKSLTTVDVSSFDTSNVTNMSYLFGSCSNLTSLDLSSFDASEVNNISSMFLVCSALTNLTFMRNLGKGFTQQTSNHSSYKLSLSTAEKLTYDSLINVINNLYDLNLTYKVADGKKLYTQSLILGSTNLAKLTADDIAIATNKGWVVS